MIIIKWFNLCIDVEQEMRANEIIGAKLAAVKTLAIFFQTAVVRLRQTVVYNHEYSSITLCPSQYIILPVIGKSFWNLSSRVLTAGDW